MRTRIYIFDWDHNIVSLPSYIQMEKFDQDSNQWVEKQVESEEFKKIRDRNDYRLSTKVDNPFESFRDDREFLNDVYKAIERWPETKGPSFDKFKECILNKNEFCIITARGHSVLTMKTAILLMIYSLFTKEELESLKDKKGSIGRYLREQEIFPVSSDYYCERFGIDENLSVPEKKKIGFKEFVKNKNQEIDSFNIFTKLSFGFSDDDPKNIKIIEELVEEELKENHPESHFVLYDTSYDNCIEKTKITSKKEKSDDMG